MIFRFLILSDEVANFKREIKISSEATFLDLHEAIIQATKFRLDEMASFFICDDDWTKKVEITLVDMDASSEVDTYLMESTPLEELLTDEQQKLLYVFDYLAERVFFMELSEIITGQHIGTPICSLSIGQPPAQTLSIDEIEKGMNQLDLGEDFYGDSDFNEDELGAVGDSEIDPDSVGGFEEERF